MSIADWTAHESLLTFVQVVADAVCSVASEEIRFDDWGLDVVLTASQKGLSTPPGLSILVASQKAIKVRFYILHAGMRPQGLLYLSADV